MQNLRKLKNLKCIDTGHVVPCSCTYFVWTLIIILSLVLCLEYSIFNSGPVWIPSDNDTIDCEKAMNQLSDFKAILKDSQADKVDFALKSLPTCSLWDDSWEIQCGRFQQKFEAWYQTFSEIFVTISPQDPDFMNAQNKIASFHTLPRPNFCNTSVKYLNYFKPGDRIWFASGFGQLRHELVFYYFFGMPVILLCFSSLLHNVYHGRWKLSI